jgi:hypothetical protein
MATKIKKCACASVFIYFFGTVTVGVELAMTRNTGVEEGNVGGGIDMAEVNRNPPTALLLTH